MGCELCFVVDLLEEIVGEGGSRSSWTIHEHESSELISQQNVAIRVFWSRCQPRLTLIARDLHHGKHRVSPFYHVSQILQEKNVFRSPENGMLLRSIMIWVWIWLAWLGTSGLLNNCSLWLSSNFWTQFHQVMFQGNLWRRSWWRIFFLVYDFSSFHQRSIVFDRTSILSSEQCWCHRILMFLPCFVHGLCKTRCFRVDRVRILLVLSTGSTNRKNTVCLLLKFWPPSINPELMMECKSIAHPTW